MQEINVAEIEQISGAGFYEDLGSVVGRWYARATLMQQRINAMDDTMLGAMQYGA